MHLYAVPISFIGVIGAINLGYGNPLQDEASLEGFIKYGVELSELKHKTKPVPGKAYFILNRPSANSFKAMNLHWRNCGTQAGPS